MSKPVDPEIPDPELPKGIQKSHPFNMHTGAHEEHPWMHGRHDLHAPISDGHGEGSVQVYPSQVDGVGTRKVHPFELQRYDKTATEDEDGKLLTSLDPNDTRKCLRVYYGELWDTLSVIRTSKLDASAIGGGNHYTIASQDEIPGIQRTVIPDFVEESGDDPNNPIRTTLTYAEFVEAKAGDGGAFGTVLLEWRVNVNPEAEDADGEAIPLGVIDARLSLIPSGEEVEDDVNIEQLAATTVDGVEGLRRSTDRSGIYRIVIGESRDPDELGPNPDLNANETTIRVNEDKPPLDQQVFDHVYWAATLVMGTHTGEPDEPTDMITWINVPGTTTKQTTVLVAPNPDFPQQFAGGPLRHTVRKKRIHNDNKDVQGEK